MDVPYATSESSESSGDLPKGLTWASVAVEDGHLPYEPPLVFADKIVAAAPHARMESALNSIRYTIAEVVEYRCAFTNRSEK